MWMNEYEVREMPDHFDAETQPNAERGARILLNLLAWTNNHSDGWPYWKKPSAAAERLMLHLDRVKGNGFADEVDLTDAELAGALRPIKAFLTRQVNGGGATEEERERIIDPDSYHRKIAAQAEAARVARNVALQQEAKAYADGLDMLNYSNSYDAIVDAYLAGATR